MTDCMIFVGEIKGLVKDYRYDNTTGCVHGKTEDGNPIVFKNYLFFIELPETNNGDRNGEHYRNATEGD